MTANFQLGKAAHAGDVPGVAAALASGADINAQLNVRMGRSQHALSALHVACHMGHPGVVRLLLKMGADHSMPGPRQLSALHVAAMTDSSRHVECIQALLAAGADACNISPGLTALHVAATGGSSARVRMLLEAAPAAAAMEDSQGRAPLEVALRAVADPNPDVWVGAKFSALVLARAAPPPCPKAGARVFARLKSMGRLGLHFYPDLATNWDLTVLGWQQVPSPCPFIGAALPAVLERSEAKAALLVQHMTDDDRRHLRTLALCLGAAGRRGLLPQLPTPILHRLLAESAAQHASHMDAYWCCEDKRRLRQFHIQELRRDLRKLYGALLSNRMAAVIVFAGLALLAWKLCVFLRHILLLTYRCF